MVLTGRPSAAPTHDEVVGASLGTPMVIQVRPSAVPTTDNKELGDLSSLVPIKKDWHVMCQSFFCIP